MLKKMVLGKVEYHEGIHTYLLKDLGFDKIERVKWRQFSVCLLPNEHIMLFLQKEEKGTKENNMLAFLEIGERKATGTHLTFYREDDKEIPDSYFPFLVKEIPPFIAGLSCSSTKDNEPAMAIRESAMLKTVVKKRKGDHPLMQKSEYDRVDEPGRLRDEEDEDEPGVDDDEEREDEEYDDEFDEDNHER